MNELNIVDGMAAGGEAGMEEAKPSDLQNEYAEPFAPTSNEMSNFNRSSKVAGGRPHPDVGSGLVERDANSIEVNEDLKAAVTPPNVIHEQPGERRRHVMIKQDEDSQPKKRK